MSYKSRMSPRVSKGEISVFEGLSEAGLTGGMFTQQPIYLKVTVPDFCWHSLRKVVYLDGIQVHRKKHVAQRDEEIDELLELQGWQVLRIPYDPPLSVGEVGEIVGQIKRFIGSDPDEEGI